jgi:hypothetical protein
MKNLKSLLLLIAFLLISSTSLFAASYTWNGSTSNAWGTNTNWTPNGIPGAADNVTIVTATNQPTYNGVAGVTNLTMTTGTLNLGGFTLTASGTVTCNGGTISNGTLNTTGTTTTFAGTNMSANVTVNSANVYLNGSKFSGTASFTKTGTTPNSSTGGNKFLGVTTIISNGTGYLLLASTNPDSAFSSITFDHRKGSLYVAENGTGNYFGGKVYIKLSSTASHAYLGRAGTVTFNDSILFGSVVTANIYFGDPGTTNGDITFTSNCKIGIASGGFSSGSLYLGSVNQLGYINQTLTFTGTASLYTRAETNFSGNFTFTGPNFYLQDTKFYHNATFTKNGSANNTSNGGNVFKDTVQFTNSGTGYMAMGGTNPDSFKVAATFIAATDYIYLANNSTGNYFGGNVFLKNQTALNLYVSRYGTSTFMGNIYVASSSTGNIYFGESTGTSILSEGKSIIEDAAGFTNGGLILKRFTKNGTTPINLDFASNGAITFGSTATINGDVTFTGKSFSLNGCVFNNNVDFTCNSGSSVISSGSNVFNGTAKFTNNGAGGLILASATGDDFNGNVTFVPTSGTIYPAYTKKNYFGGNITATGGTLVTFGGGGATAYMTSLDGPAKQTISGTTTTIRFKKLKLDNISGISATHDINVTDSLLFTKGVLDMTTTVMQLNDNCISSGAADISYISGKVKKTGNDAFTFPVGKYGQYRSIAMSAPTQTTDAYTAEYFWDNSNPTYSHSSKDATIAQLSRAEYWKLDRNVGTTNVSVTLSWEGSTSCSFSNMANLKVGAWDGTTWKDKGNGGTTGTATAGTIVTNGVSTTYGAYTLATSATFDCRCYDPTNLGNVNNYCLNSQSLSTATEIWYKFTTDSTNMQIEVKNLGLSTTKNIEVLEVYPFCYGRIYAIDSISSSSDTLLIANLNYIPAATTFYIRLARTSAGTGNADYNICLRGGTPGNFTRLVTPNISITECGLDFSQQSVRLNLRTQGGTNAGLSLPNNPENFVFTNIPADAVLVNAYMWFTAVNTVGNNNLGYTFSMPTAVDEICGTTTLVNSVRNVPVLDNENLYSGTCWGPQTWTMSYFDDLTPFFNTSGKNLNLNGTYSITALPNVSAAGFDVSGATLMLIYKTPCIPEVTRPATMTIWHGIDVRNGAAAVNPLNYLMSPLNSYVQNQKERAFMIVADIETNAATFDVNPLPPWVAWDFSCIQPFSTTGGSEIMHTCHELAASPAGNMNPFANSQTSLMFRIDQNGAFFPTPDPFDQEIEDCLAVAVMGAYTQNLGGNGCTPISVIASRDLDCNAPTATVDLTAAVSGGAAPISYLWTPTPNIFAGGTTNHADGFSINNVFVDFVVTAEGNDGCIASDDVIVSDCTEGAVDFDLCDATASTFWANNAQVLNKNIVINGRFNVNIDLNFDHCNFIMGPDAYIEITGTGNALDFKTCTLTTCSTLPCDYMWDGIYNNSLTNSITAGATIFENAKNAIVSTNGGPYTVSGDCLFHNCYKGVVVRTYTPNPLALHTGTISSSDFIADGALLVAPYMGQRTYAGVEVTNVYGLTIGADNPFTGFHNNFDGLRYGIKAYHSHVSVYNNHFDNIFRNTYSSQFSITPINEGAIVSERGNIAPFIPTGLYVGTDAGDNQTNAFNQCNVGVYSDRMLSKIEYNDFTNVTQGIFLKNVKSGSTISHNTSMIMNSGNENRGVGIRVENTIGSFPVRLTIRDNGLDGYRSGIVARNIPSNAGTKPFWIYQNTIEFPGTFTAATRTGIRVENCGSAIIDDNIIDKTGTGLTGGEYTRLIGLRIAGSQLAYVYENTFNDIGQGIYTTGDLRNTKFYCNEFNYNYNGFYFGPNSVITDQESATKNSSNKWFNDIGRSMASIGNNLTNTSPDANWYVNANLGAEYDPNLGIALVANVTNYINIVYNPSAITANSCGSAVEPPDAIVETPTSALREKYFGPTMRGEITYGGQDLANTYKQYDNEAAYQFIKNNSGWLSIAGAGDNAAYSSWYNTITSGNTGKILAIREKSDTILGVSTANWKAAYDTAVARNNALIPNKLIETNEKTVTSIYLNTFVKDIFQLSSSDSLTLLGIANQFGYEGGTGVYMARVMLGLDVEEIEAYKTDDEYYPPDQEIFTDIDKSFTVYPNPAKDEVNILFNGYEEGENIQIEIYDLTGKRFVNTQVYLSGSLLTLNTNELNSGIYIYRVFVASGGGGNGKLIIAK